MKLNCVSIAKKCFLISLSAIFSSCVSMEKFRALQRDFEQLQDDIQMDNDGDGVSDFFDKEPNTPAGVSVDGSGRSTDTDMDGVSDALDAEPFSNKGSLVDIDGIEIDSDNDGIPDTDDIEPNSQAGADIDFKGKTIIREVSSAIVKTENPDKLPVFTPPHPTCNALFKRNKIPLCKTIGDIDSVITAALKLNGFTDLNYAHVPPKGVAIITNTYCYNDDGTNNLLNSKKMYCLKEENDVPKTMWQRMENIFQANVEGHFRFFIFIMSNEHFDIDEKAEADYRILKSIKTYRGLSQELSKTPLSNNFECSVFVYEFERNDINSFPVMIESGKARFTGDRHLELSGISTSIFK